MDVSALTDVRWSDSNKDTVWATMPGGGTVAIPKDTDNRDYAGLIDQGITIADPE
jgi:hypothetical protein